MTPGPTELQLTDAELIRLTALGNRHAFASLYDRYSPGLFGLLLRILHSRADAEDVMQEVFLQVWLSAADFDEARGRPFTWMVILTRSRAIDRIRALSARQRAAVETQREAPQCDFSDACEDAIRSEQGRIVREALAALPDKQRNALLLAYFEGLSHSQIAARLGVPLGPVKTWTRSGLTKLIRLLRNSGLAADKRREKKVPKVMRVRIEGLPAGSVLLSELSQLINT
ncbi:MAG: sigma-70 family RNA polymerase sigma factor [Rubrivivax sp.]|nr:sigma-70 family RNA polymerase sigma factor [Pyrinomonadaceae bacterium]